MRIKNMATIREVLYQHTKKNSSRSIARSLLSFLKLDDKYLDFSDNIKFIYPVTLL